MVMGKVFIGDEGVEMFLCNYGGIISGGDTEEGKVNFRRGLIPGTGFGSREWGNY
jgi:hypothetical protein